MEVTESKDFTKEQIGIICNQLLKLIIENEKLKLDKKALNKQLNLTYFAASLTDLEKQKLIEDTYLLNLQNLSGREDFEEAFRLGIETGVNDTIEHLNEK